MTNACSLIWTDRHPTTERPEMWSFKKLFQISICLSQHGTKNNKNLTCDVIKRPTFRLNMVPFHDYAAVWIWNCHCNIYIILVKEDVCRHGLCIYYLMLNKILRTKKQTSNIYSHEIIITSYYSTNDQDRSFYKPVETHLLCFSGTSFRSTPFMLDGLAQ